MASRGAALDWRLERHIVQSGHDDHGKRSLPGVGPVLQARVHAGLQRLAMLVPTLLVTCDDDTWHRVAFSREKALSATKPLRPRHEPHGVARGSFAVARALS